MCSVQRVQLIHSGVSVMVCVFRPVSCVMATHNVMTTVMKATALVSTVSTHTWIMFMQYCLCAYLCNASTTATRYSANARRLRRLMDPVHAGVFKGFLWPDYFAKLDFKLPILRHRASWIYWQNSLRHDIRIHTCGQNWQVASLVNRYHTIKLKVNKTNKVKQKPGYLVIL